MSSTLRSFTLPVLLWLAPVVLPSAIGAQQLSAEVRVPIQLVVRPVLVIRNVVPASVRVESPNTIASSAIVDVESNLPYRLGVRLASAPSGDARVLVRVGDGPFQPLDPRGAIATISRGTPGRQSHEITCRVESVAPPGCAVVYELSAEYHDTLIRATAIGTAPTSYVLRPASQHPGMRRARRT